MTAPNPRSPAALLDEAHRALDIGSQQRDAADAANSHLRAIALALIAIAERIGR